jgi:hypothetical protein
MTDEFEDDTNQPVDPFLHAVEQIQFGSLEDGAAQLRNAMGTAMQQADIDRKLKAEAAHSQEVLAEFRRRNAGLNDAVIEPSLERQVLIEQAEDLRAVVDMAAWRNQLGGREPNVQDIIQAHLHFRAHKAPKIRGTEEILEKAAKTVAEKFGLRRQGATDPSQTILAQKNAARAKRGLPPVEQYVRSTDSDQRIASTQTPESFTTEAMGGPNTEDGAPPEQANRVSAVAKMKMDRLAARGRNVGHWDKGD